jgi:hypothetical protein
MYPHTSGQSDAPVWPVREWTRSHAMRDLRISYILSAGSLHIVQASLEPRSPSVLIEFCDVLSRWKWATARIGA